jgi:TolB-like protein
MLSTRQLAAIIFTDIVGYTALMGSNEQNAFDILRKNRHLQRPLIDQHGGKWIKELGDGVLASFNTVSDAVQAAIQIQEACNESKEFSLRIGIHEGEVVFEQEDIFGDAVNIASRIQALAPVGGIWVSETVHHNVVNKQGIATRFVKEERLKNVKETVRIYEVITEKAPSATSSTAKKENKNTQEKSIAVLPFVNMSSDPEQEYFSDGLTEEIITDLSHLKTLLVISRSSMMTFKGQNKKIKEIADEVNARYVLEGSVRKAGNNIRITAQLIDAINDIHLWAEKYSGTLNDVFDMQEKVSRAIVDALNIKLSAEEEGQLANHPIENVNAYECYIRARQEMWKRTEQGLDDAVMLAQRGIDAVGENALLYATLGTAYLMTFHYGIRPEPSYREKAKQYATKSLILDSQCAQALFVHGLIEFENGNLQGASRTFKEVLGLDRNNTDAMHFLIMTYLMSGRPDAARPISDGLLRVDPLAHISHAFPGVIDLYDGMIQESLPYFQKWLQAEPESPFIRFWYANVLVLNNRYTEGIEILDLLIRDTPKLIFGWYALFLKNSLQGDKEAAFVFATDELKTVAATQDYMPEFMAIAYALLDEKDEAVWWLNKSLAFGHAPYPLFSKVEILQRALNHHAGFQSYIQEIKKQSEQFII